MPAVTREARQALRRLRVSRGLTASAIVIMALAIGASTAIFSTVSTVLLRPLPYADPDQLVLVWGDLQKRDVQDFPFPPADFEDLRTGTTSFSGLAGLVTSLRPVSGDGFEPEQVATAGVTPNLFTLLGVPMALGRAFEDADGRPDVDRGGAASERVGGAPARRPVVAVLGNEFWRRRYGGDRTVLGRSLVVGNAQAEIVGVLAPGFELLFPPGVGIERQPAVYTALRIDYGSASRMNAFLRVIGRLRPGVSLAAAQQDVDRVSESLRRQFEIKDAAGLRIRLESMHEDLVADVRSVVLAELAAAVLVLLIGCASVGGLILVRAMRRETNLAIRRALGGSRWGICRGVLVESVMLVVAGTVCGVAVAYATLRLLASFAPAELPRLDAVGLDWPSLAVASATILLAVLAFSLVPIARSVRGDGKALLRTVGATATDSGSGALRDVVLVGQVALSFVLLIGCGLLVRSFVALTHVDPGFDAQGVLTFSVGTGRELGADGRQQFARIFQERLEALPGVVSASAAGPLPLDGGVSNVRWGTEEAIADPERFQQATVHFVLPDYFETMRTRVLAGRGFEDVDNRRGTRTVVVDRLLAAEAFPGENPVGRRLLVRVRSPEPERVEVIGVVDHERHASLAKEGPAAMFFPNAFLGHSGISRWVVRSTRAPATLTPEVRSLLRELDPMAALAEVQPMSALVDAARADIRFAVLLVALFAFLSVTLTAAGIYSSLATSVRQRTNEIGLRLALGAPTANILLMVVKRGIRICAFGSVLGAAAALVLTRYLSSLLYGIAPTDPLTFIATAAGFTGIVLLASWTPARWAARLDPTLALRER